MKHCDDKLQVNLNGFTDKLELLLERIVFALTTFRPDAKRLALVKEKVNSTSSLWSVYLSTHSVRLNLDRSNLIMKIMQYPNLPGVNR